MPPVEKGAERIFLIEQIFNSWGEYEAYYKEAGKVLHKNKNRPTVLKNLIRRYFEVEFNSFIKSPRYHYPEGSESIVLQMPSKGLKPSIKNEKRMKILDEHQHVIGVTEMYITDQIAMRLKVLGVKVKVPKASVKG